MKIITVQLSEEEICEAVKDYIYEKMQVKAEWILDEFDVVGLNERITATFKQKA